MLDNRLDQLETAMRLCGLPLTLRSSSYLKEGAGAWHDAYRVTVPQQAHPFIVRIRKPVAYGQPQRYQDHANSWHAEYVSTSLYYRLANRVRAGVCPSVFSFHVSEPLTCTVETYMGEQLNLATLDAPTAQRYGWQIGSMMRLMHRKKTHLLGEGQLSWDGANLYGMSPQRHPLIARKIEHSYNENILMALIEQSEVPFDGVLVREMLHAAHKIRDVQEPVALINRDVTPENLTVQKDGNIGVIDPYPYLGNGTRFAAWFIHCYRFLLPAYAPTERYRAKQYDLHRQTLSEIANGFEDGYIQGDAVLAQHIGAERWLWTLEQAYSDWELLQTANLPAPKIMKHGTTDIIRQRMIQALRRLETLKF